MSRITKVAFEDDLKAFQYLYDAEVGQSISTTEGQRGRPGSQQWNQIGSDYIDAGLWQAAEVMYQWALARCADAEHAHGSLMHKGVEYCNLAVSLLYQGRFEGAVLLLEAAEAEDHRYSQISHAGINVIDRSILRQAFHLLLSRVGAFIATTPITEADLHSHTIDVWSRMDRRSKVRLAGTLQDLADVTGDTRTARVARLDALQHVTHLIEGLLRESYPAAASLPQLLSNGLTGISQADLDSYSHAVGGFLPGNISGEVAGQLGTIAAAATEADVLLPSAKAMIGLRHYTHHQFNVDGTLFSEAGFGRAIDALLLVLTHLHLTTPVLVTPSLLEFVRPFPVQTTPLTPHPDVVREYVMEAAADIISDATLLDCQAHWDAGVLTVTLQVGDPMTETWHTFAGALQVELSLDGTVPVSVRLEQAD